MACGGSRATGKVDYSVTAKQNYEKGLKELSEKDWIAAAKYFSFVKARFPYSKFAVLAELRMADAEFGAGHYLQAIDSYKLYGKFHPTHEMVTNGYASFRIGESYVKMLPGDFFILPPSFEKDQSATIDAHRELSSFLKKYPSSPFIPKSKKLLLKINRRLAEHEMYVARFYWERKKPMGTVLRLRRLLKLHGGTTLDADALYLLGRAYGQVKMPDRARDAFQRLLKEHPKHKRANDAREALKRFKG
jgi:outer membrane protein assembly factor BamD